MLKYIKVMRPLQWIKNVLCFAGIIFSGKFIYSVEWKNASLIFITFSLVASSIYILNDLLDAPKDKLHPYKKNRSIASGEIPVYLAWLFFVSLLSISVIISCYTSKILLIIILVYAISNLAYSYKLKKIPILDVFIISFGFILRLLSGTMGMNIPPTKWIIICTFMLSLFFGFVKRYGEMNSSNSVTREVLSKYSNTTLENLISITASCTIISYSIFIIEKSQILLIFTIFPVCYAVFHIILDLNIKHKGEDFSKDLFANTHIFLSLIIWLISYCLINFYM